MTNFLCVMSRVVAAASAVVVTVVLVSGASVAQSDMIIHVGAAPDDQARPLLYAASAGLFKKAGLNVEITKLANGSAVAAAVAGGSLEIGKGSSLTAVQAHAKGLPFTVIGNLANYSTDAPDTAMIVLSKSSIKGPKDLAGKTIGVNGLQDFNSLTIRAWLEQNGVDAAQLQFVEIPLSSSLAAMEQGRIAATLALEPVYATSMASGKVRVIGFPWTAIGKHFSDAVMFANISWVAAHRDAVERFNRVMHDAAIYVAAHESETTYLPAQFGGFDPASLVKFHPPGRARSLDPSDLQPTIDAAAKFKLIAKAFPAQEMICDCAIKGSSR